MVVTSMVTVVAQAKLNYVFYYPPEEAIGKRKRGAPKKYGDKLQKPTIEQLQHEVTLTLYSQEMKIRYSEYVVKARSSKTNSIPAKGALNVVARAAPAPASISRAPLKTTKKVA